MPTQTDPDDVFHSPEFIKGVRQGIEDWRAGRVQPLSEVLAEMTPTTDHTTAKEPELCAWLAELPCPHIDDTYEGVRIHDLAQGLGCASCGGDDQGRGAHGLAFPWASGPCPGADVEIRDTLGGVTIKRAECRVSKYPDFPADYLAACHGGCNGSGRVPKAVGLATILNELRKLDADFTVGPGWAALNIYGDVIEKPRWRWETEEELLLAALHAIVAQAKAGMPL